MVNFHATVDRIEEKIAVLLIRDGETYRINIPLKNMPVGVKEGDIVSISIGLDEKSTSEAKERVSALMKKLIEKK